MSKIDLDMSTSSTKDPHLLLVEGAIISTSLVLLDSTFDPTFAGDDVDDLFSSYDYYIVHPNVLST